jgi:membrane protease YdiL (CAAX protease family)
VSDRPGSQPGEAAPGGDSPGDALDGAGATPAGETARPSGRPLSPDATTGWAAVVFIIAQTIGAAVVLIWYSGEIPTSPAPITYDGGLVALVTLITNPALVGLFWLVVRYRGLDAREFLGLTRFTPWDFVVGVLALAAVAAALYLAAHLAKLDMVPRFQTDTFTSARRDGWLAPLLVAVVLVGPIGEETMFRGFLYRGWVRPGFVVTPILLITLMWSAMHMQYDWFGVTQVFLVGLVLGWLRWRSGSSLLTIVLHILVNLEASIETFLRVGWTGS